MSRLPKNIGLFCKGALYKRRYSANETYIFKEPTNHSHPISVYRLLITFLTFCIFWFHGVGQGWAFRIFTVTRVTHVTRSSLKLRTNVWSGRLSLTARYTFHGKKYRIYTYVYLYILCICVYVNVHVYVYICIYVYI